MWDNADRGTLGAPQNTGNAIHHYFGAQAQADDGEPFKEKMKRLVAQIREQHAEAEKLDEAIWRNLEERGYGG